MKTMWIDGDAKIRFDWMRNHKKGDNEDIHDQIATTCNLQSVGHKMAQRPNQIQIATREMSMTELTA